MRLILRNDTQVVPYNVFRVVHLFIVGKALTKCIPSKKYTFEEDVFKGVYHILFYFKNPLFTCSEFIMELLVENSLFFKVYVACSVTGVTAD